MTMDMDAIVRDVDAVKDAADRLREISEKASAIKEHSLMNIHEQDKWLRYKQARKLSKEAEEIKQEAMTEYKRAEDRRTAVIEATRMHEHTLASDEAVRAYLQANKDLHIILGLVAEAIQNCDAIEKDATGST